MNSPSERPVDVVDGSSAATATGFTDATQMIDLEVTGMTCASCVSRVERKLGKVPGVSASVNLATATARVTYPSDLDVHDLIRTVEAAGYGAKVPTPTIRQDLADPALEMSPEDSRIAGLRTRLVWSAILGAPVAVVSMVPALQFNWWQWIATVLTLPVVIWGGWPFHSSAAKNARHLSSTMDTLVSLGITAATAWSVWALFFGGAGGAGYVMSPSWIFGGDSSAHSMDNHEAAHLYLEVAIAVTVFLLLGRYLEAKAKRRSGDALRALLALGSPFATRVRDGIEERVPVEDLHVGDLIRVQPGETIATDAEVINGDSTVDESMLTGESMPIDVTTGSAVTGGTVNGMGSLLIQATRVGAETRLATITRLVVDAQAGKAPVQKLVDRVSAVFVPIVLVLAVVTLTGWLLLTGEVQSAFTAAVAVLVIACPCALGLATPTALLVGTGRGAQIGVLVTGPQVLEETRRIDTVILDKTGTLTTGIMTVTSVLPVSMESAEFLRLVGAVEQRSEHPIAAAVTRHARDRAELPEVDAFTAVRGMGASGQVDGRQVLVGRPSWLAEQNIDVSAMGNLRTPDGSTVIAAAIDGSFAGVISVADEVREESRDAVRRLSALGLEPWMVTGDSEAVAHAVAEQVGIPASHVIAAATPEGKVDAVADLQAKGRVVAMVGDGINDAAGLAQADVGIAMGSGTDAAIAAGDLTLVRAEVSLAADAIRLARATLRTIKGNLVWAFAYNVAAIPLAMAGLLDPVIAALAMAFSSVFVVTNSLRLKRFTPGV
jgi:P-type Cu+ transporter